MCNPIAAIGTILKGGATAATASMGATAASAAMAANVAAATATLGQFAAIGSGVMGVAGAAQQHKMQQAQFEANQQNALQAQMDEQRQINLKQAQEDTSAAEQKIANDLAVREQVARATTAESETGVMLNNNAVVQDMQRQGLVANTTIDRNLEGTVANLEEQRLGSKTRTQSRINSVSRPSKTATGIKIGQSVLGAAQGYSQFS